MTSTTQEKIEQPDIVERLRHPSFAGPLSHLQSWYEIDTVMASAASEIERLRQELAEARARALEEAWMAVGGALGAETQAVQRKARAAIRALAAGKEG